MNIGVLLLKNDKKKNVIIKNFYWTFFLFGWTTIPYIFLKAKIETIVMALLTLPFLFCMITYYVYGNIIQGIGAICVLNFFTLLLVSCHYASYGYRIEIRALIKNGWRVCDKNQAARAALSVLGLC